MRIRMRAGVVGTLAVVAVACSSGGSDGGGTGAPDPASVTSVDATKGASSLSDTEADQYCRDLQSYITAHLEDIKRFACVFISAFSSLGAKTDDEAKSMCRQTYNECLSRPLDASASTQGTAVNVCPQFVGQLKACSTTVLDLNQCFIDQIAALSSVNADSLCAEAKAASSGSGSSSGASALSAIPQPPASCTRLQANCPTVFQTQSTEHDAGADPNP